MPGTLTCGILAEHLVEGRLAAGKEVGLIAWLRAGGARPIGITAGQRRRGSGLADHYPVPGAREPATDYSMQDSVPNP